MNDAELIADLKEVIKRQALLIDTLREMIDTLRDSLKALSGK